MLSQALSYWNALQPYRAERLRCKNYTFGRQYVDHVIVDGRQITEEEYIRSEGNVPLKNNLIRRIVRNVLGVFRNNMRFPTAPSLGLDENDADDIQLFRCIEASMLREDLKELYARLMEEYLIGGMVAVRKRPSTARRQKFKSQNVDLPLMQTDTVRPDSFFFSVDSNDPRGRDVTAIGEIHSVPLEVAVSTFATSPEDAQRFRVLADSIKSCFAEGSDPHVNIVEYWRLEQRRFWLCHDRASGRVFRSGERPESNDIDAIWRSEPVWRYYFIDSDGEILLQGDSPYGNAGHPYVLKAYPFIDGEIHSFVADCIDQQRYVNRLITLNDWILRSSAKGVLLFPKGALPEGMEMEDISDQWARYNGVISYKPETGVPAPHQVSHNVGNIGISELLSVQLKMMEDVSGVNSALQGQLSSGAVSGTLFEMQTRQALTGLADIIEGFENFMRDCALKEVEMMRALS